MTKAARGRDYSFLIPTSTEVKGKDTYAHSHSLSLSCKCNIIQPLLSPPFLSSLFLMIMLPPPKERRDLTQCTHKGRKEEKGDNR